MQDHFPLILPDIPSPESWVPLLEASYKANHFSNTGPLVATFEKRVNDLFDNERKALTCSNATAGLQIVLSALNSNKKKVIIPSFTFAATAHAVVSAGFEPLFVDIDPRTSELDFSQVEEVLNTHDDIVAVMHVRSFGFANDLSPLENICEKYGAPLIVDSASGFGGRLSDKRMVGHQGIAEVFSFHATKTFSIGEGGLIVGHKDLIEKSRLAANFGITEGGSITGKATNAKMSEFHAAIAHAALSNFESVLSTRQNNAQLYSEQFSDLSVSLPSGSSSLAWQFYPIYLNQGNNQELVKYAHERGFLLRSYYSPVLHKQQAFKQYSCHGDMKYSTKAATRFVSLPVHRDVTPQVVEDIYSIFKSYLGACIAPHNNLKESFKLEPSALNQ